MLIKINKLCHLRIISESSDAIFPANEKNYMELLISGNNFSANKLTNFMFHCSK